jgi:hypothetical protein
MLSKLSQVQDENDLRKLLNSDYERIYDYLSGKYHSELYGQIKDFQLIVAKYNLFYKKLDNHIITLSFINLLLEVCERHGLSSQFGLLYRLLQSKDYDLSSRIKASALFLIDIKTFSDYKSRLSELIELLEYADENEEDDSDRVAIVLINYYSQIVKFFWEFNSTGIEEIRSAILEWVRLSTPYSFLRNELLKEVLNYEKANFDGFETRVQHLFNEHFKYKALPKYSVNTEGLLLESGTEYALRLENINSDFNEIRALSLSLSNDSDNTVFHSLKRGVAILNSEEQLFRYMIGYSNMHKEKLDVSFEEIAPGDLSDCEHVVDWGCGQAMGSMVFCDFLKRNDLSVTQSFTLIEPSVGAISRGSLHIRKYHPYADIHTVSKEFDHVTDMDLQNTPKTNTGTTLHIFSNILDVELFSLHHLTSLVESNFSGHQLFICISPYINEMRTSRIESFVNHFQDFESFELIASKDYKKGEWKNNWTKVMRVFRVKI